MYVSFWNVLKLFTSKRLNWIFFFKFYIKYLSLIKEIPKSVRNQAIKEARIIEVGTNVSFSGPLIVRSL